MSNYIHGKPYRSGNNWFRKDIYKPTGNPNRFFISGKSDDSSVYNGRYNSKCPCCWLGFGHTVDYHIQSLKEQK